MLSSSSGLMVLIIPTMRSDRHEFSFALLWVRSDLISPDRNESSSYIIEPEHEFLHSMSHRRWVSHRSMRSMSSMVIVLSASWWVIMSRRSWSMSIPDQDESAQMRWIWMSISEHGGWLDVDRNNEPLNEDRWWVIYESVSLSVVDVKDHRWASIINEQLMSLYLAKSSVSGWVLRRRHERPPPRRNENPPPPRSTSVDEPSVDMSDGGWWVI